MLECPAMLHGSPPLVRRRCTREAMRWADALVRSEMPTVREQSIIEPGSLVLLDPSVGDAFQRDENQWRWYALSDFASTLAERARSRGIESESSVYASLEVTPWGALTLLWMDFGRVTPENMARRIRTVIEHWNPLDTLSYVAPHPSGKLESIVEAKTWLFLEMWLDEPRGDLRSNLETATSRMLGSNRHDAIERIVRSFLRITDAAAKGALPDRLRDREWISNRVSALDDRVIDQLASGVYARLHARIVGWKFEIEKTP